jgi:hypothetical protein
MLDSRRSRRRAAPRAGAISERGKSSWGVYGSNAHVRLRRRSNTTRPWSQRARHRMPVDLRPGGNRLRALAGSSRVSTVHRHEIQPRGLDVGLQERDIVERIQH